MFFINLLVIVGEVKLIQSYSSIPLEFNLIHFLKAVPYSIHTKGRLGFYLFGNRIFLTSKGKYTIFLSVKIKHSLLHWGSYVKQILRICKKAGITRKIRIGLNKIVNVHASGTLLLAKYISGQQLFQLVAPTFLKITDGYFTVRLSQQDFTKVTFNNLFMVNN